MNIDMTTEQFLAATGRVKDAKRQPNRKVTKSDRTKLEDTFLAAWRVVAIDLPQPTPQFKFHDKRKWRFDFAFEAQRIAVELQGGGFVRGAHNRGPQQAKDFEKINAAARFGWRVLQYGTIQMKHPYAVASEVADILRNVIGHKITIST